MPLLERREKGRTPGFYRGHPAHKKNVTKKGTSGEKGNGVARSDRGD